MSPPGLDFTFQPPSPLLPDPGANSEQPTSSNGFDRLVCPLWYWFGAGWNPTNHPSVLPAFIYQSSPSRSLRVVLQTWGFGDLNFSSWLKRRTLKTKVAGDFRSRSRRLSWNILYKNSHPCYPEVQYCLSLSLGQMAFWAAWLKYSKHTHTDVSPANSHSYVQRNQPRCPATVQEWAEVSVVAESS